MKNRYKKQSNRHTSWRIKTRDKTSDKILNYLKQHEYITTNIASNLLGLSVQRARAILGKMSKDKLIIAERCKKYRKNTEK